MTLDLSHTYCVPCPSCGRLVAAGTRCRWHAEEESLAVLLQRAAVLAARTGSRAQRGIREAIEATKGEER